MFGPRDLARMTWGQLYFRLRGAENSDHIDAARQAALAFVAGHSVADIVSLGEEIYDDTMADRIWEGARELTQRHLNAGQRVWLVTATPVELASILSRRLGLTRPLRTVAETVDGVHTRRLVGARGATPLRRRRLAAVPRVAPVFHDPGPKPMHIYRGFQSGIMEDGFWTPHIRPPLSDRTAKAGCCVRVRTAPPSLPATCRRSPAHYMSPQPGPLRVAAARPLRVAAARPLRVAVDLQRVRHRLSCLDRHIT